MNKSGVRGEVMVIIKEFRGRELELYYNKILWIDFIVKKNKQLKHLEFHNCILGIKYIPGRKVEIHVAENFYYCYNPTTHIEQDMQGFNICKIDTWQLGDQI